MRHIFNVVMEAVRSELVKYNRKALIRSEGFFSHPVIWLVIVVGPEGN